MTMLRLGLSLAFAGLLTASVATAQSSAVVASGIEPPGPTLSIAADRSNAPTAAATLGFRLAPLSPDLALTSCALRVVLAEGVPRGDDNGVILQLLNADATSEPARPIAALRVPPGTPQGAAVVLRSRDLCTALRPALGSGEDVRFRLQTTIRNGALTLHGATPETPAQVPRLLLSTERSPDLGPAEWGQIRHDAGHSGRSDWRLYDPAGAYAPTSWAARAIPVTDVRTDLRQSPLLYRDRILTVTDLGAGKFRLAAVDRSGAVLAQTTRDELPRFLAAGGPDRLVYVAENRILVFDPFKLGIPTAEIATPATETVIEAPTIADDGALYTVTNRFVRGFTAGLAEAWRFRSDQTDIGAVALGADQATAYVLMGGASPKLLALDPQTGDCRWEQALPAILHGPNEPMPIPVVAGPDVLVTTAFPTADTLVVVHDTPPAAPLPDRGGVVPPSDTPCRATAAPRGSTIIGAQGDHIPAPMAGTAQDAWYLRAGALCRGRSRGEDGVGDVWAERCRPLAGCDAAATRQITLMIGDSGGGASTGHLYGLAAGPKQLFFIVSNLAADGDFAPACRMQGFPDLGPNLVLAADGTLINASEKRSLQAIIPASFGAGAADITLSAQTVRDYAGSVFRAPGTITTAPDLALPADSDLGLVAGGKIVFAPGLKIANGARLRARVGF
jgi:hypothetical protein